MTTRNIHGNVDNHSSKKEILIGWVKPKEGFVKLNTNGCCKLSSLQASAGGFIWNEEGRWITGFMANISQCDSLTEEIWAALFGLEMVWNTGFRRIILEMDSLVLSKMIKEQF